MSAKTILPLFLSLFSVCTVHAQRLGPVTPDEVIRQLTSSDYKTALLFGVPGYSRLPEDQRTAAVKAALVQALKNENERIRLITLRSGEDMYLYETDGPGEAFLSLVRNVYELRDPSTIPVLLPSCSDEMIDFGREAFEPVLRFVEAPPPGIRRHAISNCLDTLRMMVDYWGLATFSTSEHQRMKQMAEKYIVNPEFNTMIDAIRLAASLQERALLEMANVLVNDDVEMTKREVGNIDYLQEITAQALAGTLKERQYVPYEERQKRRY